MSKLKVIGTAIIENNEGDWLVILDIGEGDPTEANYKSMEISEGRLLLNFDVKGEPWRTAIDLKSNEGKALTQALYNGQPILIYAANGPQNVLFGPHHLSEKL